MTYTESVPILKNLPEKYNFTHEEKEAFANLFYVCVKKAKEEKSKPECVYHVGKYYFHNWKDAMTAVRNYKEKYIIEKRTDVNGNMVSKKYTISNGKILGVKTL